MISRRVFLKNGGLALVSLGFAPTFLARTVEGMTARQKVLIAIFQRGAVDGLNMVVPFGDRDYYGARPTLAIARPGADENTAIDLDGFFGLHPSASARAPRAATSSSRASHMPATALSPSRQSRNAPTPGSTIRSARASAAGSSITTASCPIRSNPFCTLRRLPMP